MIVWQNFRTKIVFTAEKELPNTMLLEICPDLWSVWCACLHAQVSSFLLVSCNDTHVANLVNKKSKNITRMEFSGVL